MQRLKALLSSLLPRSVYRALLKPYHFFWAVGSAVWYGFPAKELIVIGVTGTKGKSSVCEMLTAILEEDGNKVALSSTIHFKIGKESKPNLHKMTLPGRGFLQKFFYDAERAGCTHAVVELTSESVLQYRHLFTYMDALVFTNLAREHIESHGGIEQYFQAKFRLGRALERSNKRPRAIIANADDEYGKRFLELSVEQRIPFELTDAAGLSMGSDGVSFQYEGARFALPHPGAFSTLNALASLKAAWFFGIPYGTSARALGKLAQIPGRAERVEAGQEFITVVDYAHTPDSLSALYAAYPGHRKICVLGNTGGGRDSWKRPEMGRIADEACDEVVLTNEDPYDEDPVQIVAAMAEGMKRAPHIIMDRRDAIRTALSLARPGDAVLITGKGTDPFIMGAAGLKTPWSDSKVAREELEKMRA